MSRGRMATAFASTGLIAAVGVACLAVRIGLFPARADALKSVPPPALASDQAFAWEFSLPSDRGDPFRVRLVIRESELPLSSNGGATTVGIPSTAMKSADAKREFGTSIVLVSRAAPSPECGTAAVQLLDLRDLGAASTRAGQTLRVLAKLEVGGASVRLAGDDIILPAGSIAGFSRQPSGTWTNGELYLMRFTVRGEASVFNYDVLLVADPFGAGH